MTEKKKKSRAQRVREVAERLGEFRPVDLADALDPPTRRGRQDIIATVHDFVARGEMERIGPARYAYRGRATVESVTAKAYRAMHIKGTFSVADIAMLTDADESYLRTVIKALDGQVAEAGTRRGARGRMEKIYRVVDRDRFYLENVKRYTPPRQRSASRKGAKAQRKAV